METRDIATAGIWAFAIISLLGGILGQLDGLWIVIFFLAAVIVSVGLAAMPRAESQMGSPR